MTYNCTRWIKKCKHDPIVSLHDTEFIATMEVLSEEESLQVLQSMSSPFLVREKDHGPPSPSQQVLLVHGPREEYKLASGHELPRLETDNEVLVRTIAIGLNPVDWKGPDYNFGLPSLPWINGRDFAGVVVKASRKLQRLRIGDIVLSPSTDYRDIRKAAFQEYVVSTEFNCARVPRNMPIQESAAVGVAYVAATISLGICLGVDFSVAGGPDLLSLVRSSPPSPFPDDIREECMDGIALPDRPKKGDWIAIWGASTATGFVAAQLAKLAGLRVIGVVDVAKHGDRLSMIDVLVDRLDSDRAIQIIKGVTNENLRFGFDAVGKETAELLRSTLAEHSHLVGLTGLPKTTVPNVVHHNVPIKAFHSIPKIGEALMVWMEKLLLNSQLSTPQVVIADGGLLGVNQALDVLRNGKAGAKRIVVPVYTNAVTA